MRRSIYVLVMAGSLLSACNRSNGADAPGPRSPGRYAGIGTFEAGRLWRETAGAPSSNDSAAAKLDDDEHVIVVLDSHTGEEIIELLCSIRAEKQTTLIMATHDAKVAARAPKVVELVDGQIKGRE